MHESLRQFHPVIAKWFEERVGIPTPPQVMGLPVIGAVGDGLDVVESPACIEGVGHFKNLWTADNEIALRGNARPCGHHE